MSDNESCPPEKIRNPATGRCVLRTGAIGHRILGCPDDKIRNPKTGRYVSRTGTIGPSNCKLFVR